MMEIVAGGDINKNHPLVARILKGMIAGCIISIVVLLPFHYLHTTYFDDIHDEFLVTDSDNSGIESLYYFLSWMVIGFDTPPEATHQTPALSYFLPTILAWIMIGGIVPYLKMKLKKKTYAYHPNNVE